MSGTFILKPYERRRELGPVKRILFGIGLVLLAAFYGLLTSVLPPQLLAFPAIPILVMIGLILWMLPDVGGLQEQFLAKGVIGYIALSILWPPYIAVNLPGLPYTTPTRVFLFITLAVFVFTYATSSELRTAIAQSTRSIPWLSRFFWLFWAATTFSLVFSGGFFNSLTKYANNQIFWTFIFIMSAWLSWAEGFATRYARAMAWPVIIVAVLSLAEYIKKSVFWLPWIPNFLKADPESYEMLAKFSGRFMTNIYRVHGTFTVPLYFAEYLAISFPFVVHAFIESNKAYQRFLLLLAVFLMMSIMIFTDSRSAAVGMILTLFMYAFMLSWKISRSKKSSLGATSVVFGYPGFALLLAFAVLFWRRLHVMVLGGEQHQGSSDARSTQWAMGWPKIFSHPFGHGTARSGGVLGFKNPGHDNYTVDSYYLTLLLDYGFLGLAFYMAMFGVAIFYSFTGYMRARCPDMLALGPIAIALTNFIIIKSVSSTEINFPIVVVMLGCVFGVVGREARKAAAAEAAAAAAIPGPNTTAAPRARPYAGLTVGA